MIAQALRIMGRARKREADDNRVQAEVVRARQHAIEERLAVIEAQARLARVADRPAPPAPAPAHAPAEDV